MLQATAGPSGTIHGLPNPSGLNSDSPYEMEEYGGESRRESEFIEKENREKKSQAPTTPPPSEIGETQQNNVEDSAFKRFKKHFTGHKK